MVCRLKPEKPRLRINSEDIDTGPPNANQNVNKIQKSTIITITNCTTTNTNPTYSSNTKIVPITVAATETANAAKSLASYCQYDSVDLDNLENIDVATNPFTTPMASSNKNPSKILDECDLKYDTTAITSI